MMVMNDDNYEMYSGSKNVPDILCRNMKNYQTFL